MLLLSKSSPRWARRAATVLSLALVACGGDDAPSRGVLSVFDVSPDAGPFEAPFPIAHRARPDGSLRIGDFPTQDSPWLSQLVATLEAGRTGFSLNGGIWLPFDGAVDAARLPSDPVSSTSADSPVVLVAISPQSPAYGERVPIEVSFRSQPGPRSPANLLVVLPYQGVVLEQETTYAVVVRRGLGDADGKPLYPAESLDVLLRGDEPAGPHGAALAEAFDSLTRWLDEEGIAPSDVAAATVFTTGDPLQEMVTWHEQVAATPAPEATEAVLEDSYEHFCVITARSSLPVFQRGPKPYDDVGTGHVVVDDDGSLVEQERDDVELVFTIPKTTMPDEGYPLVVYVPDATAGPRQLVDMDVTGEAGMGPARHHGARGVGAIGWAAPLTGERHPTGADDGADFESIANLAAFRGNLHQAILDVTTVLRIAQSVAFDGSVCPEATTATGQLSYDPSRVVIQGHGTGGVAAAAAIALEETAHGAVLSGLGGSFISAASLAESRPGAAVPALSEQVKGRLADQAPDRFDPALTLLPTALESNEAMSWGRPTVTAPLPGRDSKHVLLVQGFPDADHVPRMVDAYAMSLGLDLISTEVDPASADDYALVGRGVVPPPVKGNVDRPAGDVTAVTTSHDVGDGDGHDVVFELDVVKHRYACFVETLFTRELPTVPGTSDDPFASCP
ncbi:MAG: hypothetical protein RIF41_25605 [Polyangiaceae bacterium]